MWDQAPCTLSREARDGERLSHLGPWGPRRRRLWICSSSHPAAFSPLSLYPPAASSVQRAPPVQQRGTGWEDTFYRRRHPTQRQPYKPSTANEKKDGTGIEIRPADKLSSKKKRKMIIKIVGRKGEVGETSVNRKKKKKNTATCQLFFSS